MFSRAKVQAHRRGAITDAARCAPVVVLFVILSRVAGTTAADRLGAMPASEPAPIAAATPLEEPRAPDWLQTAEATQSFPRDALGTDTADWLTTSRVPYRVASVTVILGVALAVMIIWLRPAYRLATAGSAAPPHAQVLSTLKISAHCGLHLVQLDRHRVIVGVDRTGIRELAIVPDTFEEVLDRSEPTAAGQPDAPQPSGPGRLSSFFSQRPPTSMSTSADAPRRDR